MTWLQRIKLRRVERTRTASLLRTYQRDKLASRMVMFLPTLVLDREMSKLAKQNAPAGPLKRRLNALGKSLADKCPRLALNLQHFRQWCRVKKVRVKRKVEHHGDK